MKCFDWAVTGYLPHTLATSGLGSHKATTGPQRARSLMQAAAAHDWRAGPTREAKITDTRD